MNRPTCSKCGEPARVVVALARVRFELLNDGGMGRVVEVTPTLDDEFMDSMSPSRQRYICGGGHEWTVSACCL